MCLLNQKDIDFDVRQSFFLESYPNPEYEKQTDEWKAEWHDPREGGYITPMCFKRIELTFADLCIQECEWELVQKVLQDPKYRKEPEKKVEGEKKMKKDYLWGMVVLVQEKILKKTCIERGACKLP
eukprot:UN07344